MRVLLLAGAVAAAVLAGTGVGSARYEGPWCAHMSLGHGFIQNRCEMRSYEMCRSEIAATPGTWCTQNPHYRGPDEPPLRRKARR